MARKPKSVYKRIDDKKEKIKQTEELLVQLNNELQTLYDERDSFEMKSLFDAMKEKGLNIEEALNQINNCN